MLTPIWVDNFYQEKNGNIKVFLLPIKVLDYFLINRYLPCL